MTKVILVLSVILKRPLEEVKQALTNQLPYGEPGTGKTELAKLRAELSDISLMKSAVRMKMATPWMVAAACGLCAWRRRSFSIKVWFSSLMRLRISLTMAPGLEKRVLPKPTRAG